jgi:hypothetical protein
MTTRIPETRDVVQWQNSTINGRIERKLLEGVGMFDIDLGSEGLMYPPAAKAFKEMVAAAAEEVATRPQQPERYPAHRERDRGTAWHQQPR